MKPFNRSDVSPSNTCRNAVRGLPLLLKVRPCGVFFGTIPTLGQGRLAQERCFVVTRGRVLFEYGHECSARDWEIHVLQQPHDTLLVYNRFDSSYHVCISSRILPEDVIHRERETLDGRGPYLLAGTYLMDTPITAGTGVRVDLDLATLEVHDPALRHPYAGV